MTKKRGRTVNNLAHNVSLRMKLTNEQKLRQRKSLPLDLKIEMTIARVKAWFEHWDGDVCLGLSGGKDSQVLGHIITSLGGKYANIAMPFSNTGLEMPEIVEHVRHYLKGELGWNVEEVRPKKTYQEVWQTEGIHLISKRTAKALRVLSEGDTGKNSNMFRLFNEGINSSGKPAPRWKIAEKWRPLIGKVKTTEKCCKYLKKDPLNDYKKRTGLKAFTGMMVDEGGERSTMTQCNAYDQKIPMSSPLLFWTESDIWEYIERFKVKICSVYYARIFNSEGEVVACDDPFFEGVSARDFVQGARVTRYDTSEFVEPNWIELIKGGEVFNYIKGEARTGCMFCAFGAHLEKGSNRFQRMSVSHPRQHRIIMDRIGMREPLGMIGVKVTFDE